MFDDDGRLLSQNRRIRVHRLVPDLGDFRGGDLVNVTGTSFYDFGDVKCSFGARERVAGTVVSASRIVCRTPPYPEELLELGRADVRVEVSLNGVDYTSSVAASSFTFYDRARVRFSLVEPAGGPLLGGTRITVHGSNFEGPGGRARGGLRSSNAELLLRLKHSKDHISPSAYVRCVWTRGNESCVPGVDCRADCMRPGDACPMKTAGTYLDVRRVVCLSPPAPHLLNASNASLPPTPMDLDLTFDEASYSAQRAPFVYYDPAHFGVSHLDPVGGPDYGGTLLFVHGAGFARLGAAGYVQPNGTDSNATGWDTTHRWWKVNPENASQPWVEQEWNLSASVSADGPDDTEEGAYCLFGTAAGRPSLAYPTRVPASVVSPTRIMCRAPRYGVFDEMHGEHVGGEFVGGFRSIDVRVVVNDDDVAATLSRATYTYYDNRAGRIQGIDTFGGPPRGGTWVRVTGRGFADLRRRGGELSTASELVAFDVTTDAADEQSRHGARYVHQLRRTGAGGAPQLWSAYDGPTDEGGAHLLQCRFGMAGHSDAVLTYETSYELDAASSLPAVTNYTGAWEAVPALLDGAYEPERPRPTVWCQAPPFVETGALDYLGGHSQSVAFDLTLNGQDYLMSGRRQFLYYPIGKFEVNCSARSHACLDKPDYNETMATYDGVHITQIQPFGGPADGGTTITLIGRYFRPLTQGPATVLCCFGEGATTTGASSGGPARNMSAGSRVGLFPWQSPATIVDGNHAVCVTPPHEVLAGGNESYSSVPIELSVTGQLADRTSNNITFEYYGPAVLSTRWLYPRAGSKRGGTDVTIYGTGFKPLVHPIMPLPTMHRASLDIFGKPGVVAQTTDVVQCMFGDLPVVEALLLYPIGSNSTQLRSDEAMAASRGGNESLANEPLASAVVCAAPPFGEYDVPYHPSKDVPAPVVDRCATAEDRILCELDEPKTVCVRVTLNNNVSQNSGGPCVEYTYYDE